jgi:phosphoglycerate dehydrogenase-like enzyme
MALRECATGRFGRSWAGRRDATMPTLNLLVLGSPEAPHLQRLTRLPREVSVSFSADGSAGGQASARAQIVFCDMLLGGQLASIWPRLGALRWVHSISAGVDHLLFPELVSSNVVLTNGRGAYKRSLAEFVIAGALHFAKDVPRLERQLRDRQWRVYEMEELHGRTLGIVGYGEIGRATAGLARAFGMRVLALRRHAAKSAGDGLIERVLPRERLGELMGESDYVVVAAALTPETRGLVDRVALAAMKPTGVLINVGRGAIVDERALVEALRERRIRGAVLDVFADEPLPDDHPLYALDNVLLSPHTADRVRGWLESAVDVFLTNVERYRGGAPLLNVVDKHLGY